MKLQLTFIALLALIMASCSSEEKPDVIQPKNNGTSELKPGTVTEINTTTYEGESFENPVHLKLLKELDICGPEIPECPNCATCTPSFFRFFDIDHNRAIEDLFAVQIKAETILKGQKVPTPTRVVQVWFREKGTLVHSNEFRGYIVERIASKSGVDDLVIRFYKEMEGEDTFFHCLFRWNEGGKTYDYKSVEAIYGKNWGGPVKDEFKEETSKEVMTELKMSGYIY